MGEPSGPDWTRVGPSWAEARPDWAEVGIKRASSGPAWASRARLGRRLGELGPIGPALGRVGPDWAGAGPDRAGLGLKWADLGAFAAIGRVWKRILNATATKSPSCTQIGHICDLSWPGPRPGPAGTAVRR